MDSAGGIFVIYSSRHVFLSQLSLEPRLVRYCLSFLTGLLCTHKRRCDKLKRRSVVSVEIPLRVPQFPTLIFHTLFLGGRRNFP